MQPDPQIRGAIWRVWDLHVHTPKSLFQLYGQDNDETWDKYLDELEKLPRDIRVLGINDYWFLDGYKKVVAAKTSGRLPNIEMIFPVVEMRLDQFGGTAGSLKKVNLHVIFDPELDVDVIEAQFINALQPSFRLLPGVEGASWQGTITRDSLTALGAQIKSGVPKAEKIHYGSNLVEGFNNLTVPIEAVRTALESSFLRGRAILGLGKTEWASIKWNEQSIANKKSLVTEAKFLFTAYEDPTKWGDQVAAMKAANVNHKILDCSDAHTWSTANDNKDRLGACSTWMNTTPSFAGLLHALEEFDQRVFVGLEPPALARHQSSPERFIDTVTISSSDKTKASAFDYSLPLNPGFVAIVGNKGQGKSALLDSIALAGNSSRSNEFAFLTPQRFLNAANKSARLYNVDLSWLNGSTRTVGFGDQHVGAAPVQVEYLPQRYVERVCTIDPLSDESHEFEDELREVLFTHIPDDERAGETSFDALLAAKTEAAKSSTAALRIQLRAEAERYVTISTFLHENPLPDVKAKLDLKANEIAVALADLQVASDALKLSDVAGEGDDETKRLRIESSAARTELERARASRVALLQQLGSLQQQQATLLDMESRLKALETTGDEINRDWAAMDPAADAATQLVAISVQRDLIVAWRGVHAAGVKAARSASEESELRISGLEIELKRLDNLLAAADGARELARQRVLQIEERLKKLRGSSDFEGSEAWLADLLARASAAPAEMEASGQSVRGIAEQIHGALEGELTAVTDLYGPASRYIDDSQVVKNAGLEFKAELSVISRLANLRSMVDGRKSPDLLNWLIELPERLDGKVWTDIEEESRSLFKRLTHDRGAEQGQERHPTDALRNGMSAVDFITDFLSLEWIEVRFGLTGDGLPLAQLSPGQRGLVLALFYLIVDLRTTPLLLDQPEENLDNATIASLLVPAIQEASRRRQTIIVTHNANMAIVGDADQIVHCTLTDGTFDVTSGCISELAVAKSAVDVLEGTKPAFDIRRHKYEAFPALT